LLNNTLKIVAAAYDIDEVAAVQL